MLFPLVIYAEDGAWNIYVYRSKPRAVELSFAKTIECMERMNKHDCILSMRM